jgi:hypothetical protein
MDALAGIFTAFGLSASAGLNAYIPLLAISLLSRFTNLITLSSPWDTLENPWIIGLLVVLIAIEFFADKVPAVNHVNDIIQTVIRPVAGALLFAASAKVVTNVHPVISLGAGLLVAGSVHAVKSLAIRPAVTATTGGVGNAPVSMLEDIIAGVVSILSIVIPVLFAVVAIIITSWIVWKMWFRSGANARHDLR